MSQALANRPDILTIQPEPLETRCLSYPLGKGRAVTAILRPWRPGHASLCRLCEECTAQDDDTCFMMVGRPISEADAPLFSPIGMAIEGGA